ncbi:unnamed protein product [Effrenium voratum]|uniref:Uncharacterized protein n=1 Tax=Effrenium voratum TaxID=2562239 RepID=A0AA36IEL5_9DINO|nr:unnamed protein product [Effrenium voratum]
MIGGMLIMYDLFAVPLQAFNPPETPALLAMDWITLVFWTVNVGASLTTGYVQEGNTIMDPHLIAQTRGSAAQSCQFARYEPGAGYPK